MSDFVMPTFNSPEEIEGIKPIPEDFVIPTAQNLGIATDETVVVPDFVKKMSPMEAGLVGAGSRTLDTLDALKEGWYRLGQVIPFTDIDNSSEIADIERERAARHELNRYMVDRPEFGYGETAADVGLGFAVPFLRGKGLIGTALKNMAPQAAYMAATTGGGAGNRTEEALKGAAGAGVMTGALGLAGKGYQAVAPRVVNAMRAGADKVIPQAVRSPLIQQMLAKKSRAKWSNLEAAERQRLAESIGAPTTIGDLAPETFLGGVVRQVENMNIGIGSKTRTAQAAAIKNQLRPDNKVAKGIEKTAGNSFGYNPVNFPKNLSQRGTQIFAPVDQLVRGKSITIDPTNMRDNVNEMYRRFPKLFDESNMDQDVVARLDAFRQSPHGVTYDEFREVQKAVGKAQARARDLVFTKEFPKEALSLAKKAYASSANDLNSWGQSGVSASTKKRYQQVIDAHSNAMAKWKEEVLPFETNPLAKELREEGITPEQTLKKLMDPMNPTLKEKLADDLAKYSPETNDLIKSFDILNRAASGSFSKNPEEAMHWLAASGIVAHPGIAGAQQGVSGTSGHPMFKDFYFGDAGTLLPKRVDRPFLPQTPKGGLQQAGRLLMNQALKVPIGIGREFGELPIDIYATFNKPKEEGPGVVTQDSFRHPGQQ